MPPHCDSLDGPVATAARHAVEQGEVALVLPYVHATGEAEVRQAFDLAARARDLGPEAREVADRWLFETVVRVHRAGEGAAFTGLTRSQTSRGSGAKWPHRSAREMRTAHGRRPAPSPAVTPGRAGR